MIVYTYYSSPWELKSGDDIRIHNICKILSKHAKIAVYNLNHLVNRYTIIYKDRIIYISIPRKFYNLVARLLKWKDKTDLNPLIKITNYIDEFIIAVKLLSQLKQEKMIYVFGSMTLFSLFIRIFGIKGIIIYDPLSNYAQTLYLRSRRNLKEIIRYGLYLALHRLQLKSSNCIVYPSKIDFESAKRMFNINRAIIVPNPIPFCYKSINEYMKLRMKRKDFNKLYFILLAGGKGIFNAEAVKMTIEIFNEIPSNKFKLIITGPWHEMNRYVKNKSIELVGVVSDRKLKEIIATADYGLSPIFGHAAGTFLKTITYLAGGLAIICSPQSIAGINKSLLERSPRIILIHNINEFRDAIKAVIDEGKSNNNNKPITCNEVQKIYWKQIDEFLRYIENIA